MRDDKLHGYDTMRPKLRTMPDDRSRELQALFRDFVSNPDMGVTRKTTTSKTVIEVIVFLIVALLIYYGAFRAMGTPIALPVFVSGAILKEHRPPQYFLFRRPAPFQGFWQAFFQPAWMVDRLIRPDYWYPP